MKRAIAAWVTCFGSDQGKDNSVPGKMGLPVSSPQTSPPQTEIRRQQTRKMNQREYKGETEVP